MVYTEYDPAFDTPITVLLSMTIIGIPILFVFSWIDDSATRTHATEHGDEIAGRCETCGDLVRESNAHRVYEQAVDREVLVCPFGYSDLGHGRFSTSDREREKALQALQTPMWLKRLR